MPATLPPRAVLIAQIRAQIDAQLAGVAAMTAAARDEATASESRPENQYDTRALEASYLAAGQGQRLAELKALRQWAEHLSDAAPDEPVATQGCFVALRLGGQARLVLLGRAASRSKSGAIGSRWCRIGRRWARRCSASARATRASLTRPAARVAWSSPRCGDRPRPCAPGGAEAGVKIVDHAQRRREGGPAAHPVFMVGLLSL